MEPIKDKDSVLFYDTDGGGLKEAMMDYGLAYTMKMCDLRYHKGNENVALKQACRSILAKLLEFGELCEDISVQTYFQYKKSIDLIVEVYFKDGNYAAIMIEDKVDHILGRHQVTDYKKLFDECYDADNKCVLRKYWVIKAGDYGTEVWEDLCQQNEFKIVTLDKLSSGLGPDTGNDIFDEFWLRDWE